MSILETIENDLTKAQKEKKEVELMTLRLLKTALKNAEIAKRPQKLSADEEIKVLKNEVKKHSDSIEMFEHGNRQDLVAKEKAELEIIQRYLPQEMSDDELIKIAKKVVSGLGDDAKNFGKAMGAVMKEVGAGADGRRVGKILKEIIK